MKKSIITIMLAFVALAGVAQTKPSAKKPQQTHHLKNNIQFR